MHICYFTYILFYDIIHGVKMNSRTQMDPSLTTETFPYSFDVRNQDGERLDEDILVELSPLWYMAIAYINCPG